MTKTTASMSLPADVYCEQCGQQACLRCTTCGLAAYCSDAHRNQHWHHVHQYHCRPLAKECRLAQHGERCFATLDRPSNRLQYLAKLRMQHPRDYMSNRLYGMTLWDSVQLLTTRLPPGKHKAFLALAFNLLVCTEKASLSGVIKRSPTTCWQIYHALYSLASSLLPDAEKQCRSYATKKSRLEHMIVCAHLKDGVQSGVYSAALSSRLQTLVHQHRASSLLFAIVVMHQKRLLNALGWASWSRERQCSVLSFMDPSLQELRQQS